MSKEEFDNTIPVRPPSVKRKINPNTQSKEALTGPENPQREASHEKTLIPVGIAIIMVAVVK